MKKISSLSFAINLKANGASNSKFTKFTLNTCVDHN